MRPANLKTKIYLDGGDPSETKAALNLLGFLDGQTSNPTLISKSPLALKKLEKGNKFTNNLLLDLYQNVVRQISAVIPQGSISIQVYSDKQTSAKEMLEQGKVMYQWIANARIKFPTTPAGLKAAEEAVKLGMRINMTLVFTQEQAAAIYSATKGANKGQVVISPFIGRLDDKGENGISLIENIIKMFENSDQHIEVLAASIRNMEHLLACFNLRIDIVTLPYKTIKEWSYKGLPTPKEDFIYDKGQLKDIPFKELNLKEDWQQFNIQHELTDRGLEKFAYDWQALID